MSFGQSPMVHVHGWCGDHRAMLPLARAFPSRAHLLIDLPGHGRSPRAPSLAIAAHAEAVLGLCPPGAVLLGHSMGAQVVLAAAAEAGPARIAGAVLLEPAHILPTEGALAAGRSLAERLAAEEPAEVVRAFARAQLVGPPADPAGYDALVEAMAATPAEVARAQWREILAFAESGAAARALAAVDVPVLVIGCARPVNRLSDLARANRRVLTGQVAGSGHMVQWEVPDQLVPMIRRWLRLTGIA